MIAAPDFLAKRISACALPRTWVTVPGADSTMSVHMVWIESITISRGVLPSDSVAMMSSTEVSAASSTAAVAQAEPLGAQAYLRHRFFTGDVDRAMAGAGQRRGGLDQQGRFADAGIAAHQQDGAAHKAAAGDAVEFGDAGGQARGVMRVAGERLERKQAAFAGLTARPGGPLGAFLAQRVPLAASLAFALPAAEGGAAVLADEAQAALGHSGIARKVALWTLVRPKEQYKNIF